MPPETTVFKSPLGWTALSCRDNLVCAVAFGHIDPRRALRSLRIEGVEPTSPGPFSRRLIKRLQVLASGECGDDFLDVPLDLDRLTPFQQAVIQECRSIPVGQTLSYGDLARRVSHPRAARAVGSVMSSNRFPLIVPCHRVVSANSLGGFSSPQGLEMKQRLLAAERRYLTGASTGKRHAARA